MFPNLRALGWLLVVGSTGLFASAWLAHRAARALATERSAKDDREPIDLRPPRGDPQQPGEVLSSTVVVEPGLGLSGRVVDATGRPIADALVGVSDLDVDTRRTDASGEFRLLGLGRESINVFAQAKGFATKVEHHVQPGSEGVVLTLERAARVTGDVFVPSTVDHVMVSACHFDNKVNKELCVARQIARLPTARYSLDGLASGPYDLVVSAAGYPERRVAIRVAAGQTLVGPPLDPTVLATR